MSGMRILVLGVSLLVLLTAWESFYIVRPDQFVILTQFGEPIDEKREPGLYFLVPFVQDARYLDSRVRGWDDVTRNTNTAELKPIDFTAFAPAMFSCSTVVRSADSMCTLRQSSISRLRIAIANAVAGGTTTRTVSPRRRFVASMK